MLVLFFMEHRTNDRFISLKKLDQALLLLLNLIKVQKMVPILCAKKKTINAGIWIWIYFWSTPYVPERLKRSSRRLLGRNGIQEVLSRRANPREVSGNKESRWKKEQFTKLKNRHKSAFLLKRCYKSVHQWSTKRKEIIWSQRIIF